MLSGSWRRKLRFLKLAVVLAVVAAALAVGISVFLQAFYTYVPGDYEPKDIPRGIHLDRENTTR
jgi:hypothetical protein